METVSKAFISLLEDIGFVSYINTLIAHPLKIVLLILDLVIVSFLVIKVLNTLKSTRAMQLIKGIIILLVVNGISAIFSLNILHTVLSFVMDYGILLAIVVFQPELRKALEQVGNADFKKWLDIEDETEVTCIPEVVKAAQNMSESKIGMLVVFERETSLGEIAHTGVSLNSEVSSELLINIFVPDTPLHDGAVIIKDNKIQAASCILPLTDKESLDRIFGTRHRAAIGVSELTDAVAVVVSEETGTISMAVEGKIIRNIAPEQLEKELKKLLIKPKVKKTNIVNKLLEKK
ncbi:MAG: diadenylate cyclase CdaA [Clostridia bacterium]|nr:diadenylate cyclase CdaA [Clostridia bacterium]